VGINGLPSWAILSKGGITTMEEQDIRVIRVINDIIKDRFTQKAERILKFIKQAGYKLPVESKT
jgi:hypothetical protein